MPCFYTKHKTLSQRSTSTVKSVHWTYLCSRPLLLWYCQVIKEFKGTENPHLSYCIIMPLQSLRMTHRARSQSTTGEIANIVSTDVENLNVFTAHLWNVWTHPLYVVSCFAILYKYATLNVRQVYTAHSQVRGRVQDAVSDLALFCFNIIL